MILPNRGVVALSGADHVEFLQGLVTNDVGQRPAYACLLTAQGRFLHDFFVVPEDGRLLIDCEADRREDLIKRLKQFRLRAKVEIEDVSENYQVLCHPRAGGDLGLELCFVDPRHADLGYRVITNNLDSRLRGNDAEWIKYDRKRIALGIPDGSRDMVPGEALLLENNVDRFNGIAWDKGCYVGQELTARMHFKGGVKKRLIPMHIDGPAPAPGTVVFSDGVEVGEMRSSCSNVGLALLRVGAEGSFVCNGTKLSMVIASDKRSNPD